MEERVIGKHGGYRSLKCFQLARLIYDLTVHFCDCFIDRRSRTHDQMVQGARSGVQNIAEGSAAAATSKKTEIKLTQVARASLEELMLDYEDFLRQRKLPRFEPDHPVLMRFKSRRCGSLAEVREWVAEEKRRGRTEKDKGEQSVFPSSALAANAALSLLNLSCYLLDRLVGKQAADFERQGGFSERLYRIRTKRRSGGT